MARRECRKWRCMADRAASVHVCLTFYPCPAVVYPLFPVANSKENAKTVACQTVMDLTPKVALFLLSVTESVCLATNLCAQVSSLSAARFPHFWGLTSTLSFSHLSQPQNSQWLIVYNLFDNRKWIITLALLLRKQSVTNRDVHPIKRRCTKCTYTYTSSDKTMAKTSTPLTHLLDFYITVFYDVFVNKMHFLLSISDGVDE